MISPEERATCTRWVQSAFVHLEARDVTGLIIDLEGLRETFVYSNYEFWKEWEKAKPLIARLLFQELPFDEFVEVLALAKRNFYAFEVMSYLDAIADQISTPQLMVLCERFRFPHPRSAPHLVEKLIESSEPEITPWLCHAVDQFFQGSDVSQIRFYDLNTTLPLTLKILASRREEMALSICAEYLQGHRFGEEGNGSNHALLDGLASQGTDASRQLLLNLLQNDTPPSQLRIIILAKTAAFAPHEAALAALADLQSAPDASLRQAYLYWFWCNEERLETAAREISPQFDTTHWDAISRATLVDVWQRCYPYWATAPVFSTRAIFAIVALFEKLRARNWSFPALFFGFPIPGALIIWLLNRVIGPPPSEWRWLERTSTLSWIDAILLLIVLPFFCGGALWVSGSDRQLLPKRWESASMFFGWAAVFLLGCLSTRLWARWF